MSQPARRLSPAVIEALTYWPGIVHSVPPTPVDLAVLPPFFNELLGELPWWNRDWQIDQVEPAYPFEHASSHPRQITSFTEVAVPGTATCGGEALPFSGRVRFEGDRLVRFQAKIGEAVIGPAAEVLNMSAEDLAAIAGLDLDATGPTDDGAASPGG